MFRKNLTLQLLKGTFPVPLELKMHIKGTICAPPCNMVTFLMMRLVDKVNLCTSSEKLTLSIVLSL